MNSKNWIVIAAAIFAGAAMQPVMAEGTASTSKQSEANFKELDTDQDGYISEDEAKGNTALIDRWIEVDENQDGSVDITEFSAFEAPGSAENSEPAE